MVMAVLDWFSFRRPEEEQELPCLQGDRSCSSSSNSSSCCDIYSIRTMKPSDRPRIQQLHQEWFPVDYQDEFYDGLEAGTGPFGQELFTKVAIRPDNEIVACVVGTFVDASHLSMEMRTLLLDSSHHQSRLFYIMTLGTVEGYRQTGLGTTLVKLCEQEAQNDHRCGTLYLHVLTKNTAAIRLYEKLGFYRVQEIVNYYDIDGKRCNCFVYAKYFNGNRGHRGVLMVISETINVLWRQLFTISLSVWNRQRNRIL